MALEELIKEFSFDADTKIKFVEFPGNAVLSVKKGHFLDIPRNIASWVSKSSSFSHIPVNVAIGFSKCINFADGPRYVRFHNSTRKGSWNEATYYHFLS